MNQREMFILIVVVIFAIILFASHQDQRRLEMPTGMVAKDDCQGKLFTKGCGASSTKNYSPQLLRRLRENYAGVPRGANGLPFPLSEEDEKEIQKTCDEVYNACKACVNAATRGFGDNCKDNVGYCKKTDLKPNQVCMAGVQEPRNPPTPCNAGRAATMCAGSGVLSLGIASAV